MTTIHHTIASLQDKTPKELSYELAILLGVWPDALPPYATSYDVIMSVIQGLTDGQLRQFDTHVCGILAAQNDWDLWKASPADLTRALILTKQTNEETK